MKREGEGAICLWRGGAFVSVCAFGLRDDETKKEAERRQTLSPACRAAGTAAPPAGGARLSAFHHGSDPGDSSSQRPSLRSCFLGRGL